MAGYDATASSEPQKVLAAMNLRVRNWDVVITDLNLPGMDGLTLVRELKAKFASVRTIVMTAHEQTSLRAEVEHVGATALLIKPFDISQVLAVLRWIEGTQELGGRPIAEVATTVTARAGNI